MPAADERQLIHDVQEGSHAAFRRLVECYMKHAYNIAYGFVRNHDDAEDVAQESFVRVFHAIRSFRGESEFSTWLYRIVTNLALNKVKARKGKMLYQLSLNDHDVPEQGYQQFAGYTSDVQRHIERALHELPTLQRAVVILRHINGLSTRQASAILACSEGTVKTHLHRGLKKMRDKLSFLKEDQE